MASLTKFMELLRKIVEESKSTILKPCPVCSTLASHELMECLRQAKYQHLVLLDCNISVHPLLGPEEFTRLQQDPLLTVEEDESGRAVVKSRIPQCCFCNRTNPTHFPPECTHVWETWEEWRYLCYKCQRDGADHMAEECWVIGDQEQIKEELQVGLKVWREQIEHQLKGNTCPVCGQNLLFPMTYCG